MGVLAFVGAFLVGTLVAGQTTKEIIAGFPGELVPDPGRDHLSVRPGAEQRHDRLAGRSSPCARCGDGSPRFRGSCSSSRRSSPPSAPSAPLRWRSSPRSRWASPSKYGISPLLMGLMVVHGAQGGGFSPISIYGGITNRIVEQGRPAAGTSLPPCWPASASILPCRVLLFMLLGGRKLLGRKLPHRLRELRPVTDPSHHRDAPTGRPAGLRRRRGCRPDASGTRKSSMGRDSLLEDHHTDAGAHSSRPIRSSPSPGSSPWRFSRSSSSSTSASSRSPSRRFCT